MEPIYCEECGQKLVPGSEFCDNCGYKVELDDLEKEQPEMKPMVMQQSQEVEQPIEVSATNNMRSSLIQNRPKKKTKWLIWVGGFAIVLIVLVVYSALRTSLDNEKSNSDKNGLISNSNNTSKDIENIDKKSTGLKSDYDDYTPSLGNSCGNTVNLGFAVAAGDKMIFCNDLGMNGGGGETLIANIDGSDSKQFIADQCMTMDYDGEWVYYSHYLFDRGIFKVYADKSQNTKITDDEVAYLSVSGDWIYYFDAELMLHRIKKDGSEKNVLSDESGVYLNVVGEYIYYVEGVGDYGYITKMKSDGSNKQQLIPDQSGMLVYENEWLYYINVSDGSKVYRIRTDGSSKEKILDESCANINIDEGYLYYIPAGNKGLNRMKIGDTQKNTFMENEECMLVNIVEENILVVVNVDGENKVYSFKK